MKTTHNTIIRAEAIHYRYSDQTHALKGVNMSFVKGMTTALLGANGAGKTTLFLALNGILKPTAGQLFYDDKPYQYTKTAQMALKKQVGIVFQDPDDQLFSASVVQDISFGVFNLGYNSATVRQKVAEVMERLKISHLRDKPTHMLSHGQKKRVALAGVLVMSPTVIILDEPTAGLDPKGTRAIMNLLRQLQSELGLTIIMATHDVDLVPEYCDYIYVLNEGKNIVDGSVDNVLQQGDLLRSIELDTPRITQLFERLNQGGVTFSRYAHTVKRGYQDLHKLLSSTKNDK